MVTVMERIALTPTPMKIRKIRKVLVCELCLFFPKSKNTAKRKHTHTHTQTNLTRNGKKWSQQQLRNWSQEFQEPG